MQVEYKISEVVAKTGVPKSTILYYIKEGLLPEAEKLKANVHRYSDKHVELLKYIRYMQEEVGSTNEQIKNALKNANRTFSSSNTMLEPLMNTLNNTPSDAQRYSLSDFIDTFQFDASYVQQLLNEEILLPTSKDNFTHKDAAIVKLAAMFQSSGVAPDILKEYTKHAKALATLEQQMQKQLCDIRTDENFSTLWRILFESLFTVKPYIFNRTTYHAFLANLKDELSNNT
jgi:DNA-binding transcriptional MerR regulator